MNKRDYYCEYAKSLLHKPIDKAAAELDRIAEIYGDKEVEAIVSNFSTLCALSKKKIIFKEIFYE